MQFHLVYIHGFQGDYTTFQAFPTDLQTYLERNIPSGSGITARTSVYPTYKSVKPISVAVKNFLEWLSTQPPGPVILVGHSMGGLLAADAATDKSNLNPSGYLGDKPQRIVGVVAFDTPYLGMHPHVVISGIASLFPDHNKDTKSEREMNDKDQVNIVDERVTDDWDMYKQRYQGNLRPPSLSLSTTPSPSPISHSPSGSPLPSPPGASSSTPPRHSTPPSSSSSSRRSFLSKAQGFLATHANDPVVKWARKHVDDPVSASKRWVTERFEFGACMFDPSGLKERYARLVAWNGLWCNYWTQTVGEDGNRGGERGERDEEADGEAEGEGEREGKEDRGEVESREEEVLNGVKEGDEGKSEADKKDKKKKEKNKDKKAKSEHHFVVLPKALGGFLGGMAQWDMVPIAGVKDEVAAHCGLFIRHQNFDYDGLVEKVGNRVLEWCKQVKGRS